MNFISHYFRVQDKALYYKFGTLLPDLYPKFSFYFNKYISHINPNSHILDEHCDLHYGIINHYSDDKIFHQLPIFKNFIINTINYFEDNKTLNHIKRKNFVAHILFEIILDHMCIIQNPNILYNFHKDLNLIQQKIFFDFIEKSIPSSKTNVLFLRTFDAFIDKKYMNFYTEESNLIKALHSVTGHIGQWQHDAIYHQEFLKFIQSSKEIYSFNDVNKQMYHE